MPRQSRGRASAPAPRSAPAAPAQSRGAHTATAPAGYNPAAAHAPAPPHGATAAAPAQPGMLASMAATAGSVAVGSTIGHGLSSMLFGGSSSHSEAPAAPVQQQQQSAMESHNNSGMSCDVQAKDFTLCLEKADMPSCTWYLEQLKACQAAAARY